MKRRIGWSEIGRATGIVAAGCMLAGPVFAEGDAHEGGVRRAGRQTMARQRNRTEEHQTNRTQAMEQRRKNGGNGEMAVCRETFQAQRRTHIEKMRATNEAFRQGLRDQEPQAALAAVIAHRQSRFQANQSFMQTMHRQRQACARKHVGAGEDAGRLNEKIAEHEKKFAEILARRLQRHTELIARLTALQGKTDLTHDDLRSAMREQRGEGGDEPGVRARKQQGKRTRMKAKQQSRNRQGAAGAGKGLAGGE